MIRRVYEQVSQAGLVDAVVVATDDVRIYDHVCSFDGIARMTRADHPSGTDRCAEIARELQQFDLVVNVQGDEPFIDPSQIDEVVRPLLEERSLISTLARPIPDTEELFNANIVKVVVNNRQQAMYFSRSPIPFLRGVDQADWVRQVAYYKHLGLYGFRRATLLELTDLPPSSYERAESLEQLRWLEAGYDIFVGFTEQETIGIDTPADLERARSMLQQQH